MRYNIAYRSTVATKSPLKKGDERIKINRRRDCKILSKTCPHETRPRKNGEWGKEVFTQLML